MRRSTTPFNTQLLMDRALDAGDCDPQTSHAADATIDAATRRAISGR